jgi:hypothetical protein
LSAKAKLLSEGALLGERDAWVLVVAGLAGEVSEELKADHRLKRLSLTLSALVATTREGGEATDPTL